jgi:isocitrate/isopropylmalate dehydrogenase
MTAELRIGAIPGDGIGSEVLSATLPLLERAAALDGRRLEVETFDWGAGRYRETGAMMPADGVEIVRGLDAILFGAVGDPEVPDHVTLWGLLLPLRQGLKLVVNARPIRSWPGVPSVVAGAVGTDLLILRENSEGEYAGIGGRLAYCEEFLAPDRSTSATAARPACRSDRSVSSWRSCRGTSRSGRHSAAPPRSSPPAIASSSSTPPM